MDKLRVAFFGAAHPHVDAIMETIVNNSEDFEIIGFAEVSFPPRDPFTYDEKHSIIVGTFKCPEYDDWKTLASLNVDLAVVNSDNAAREEICCYLLSMGINVLDEKPMAMNYAAAKRMCDIAKENGVHMLTNWPIAWFPAFRLAKKLLDEGRIGKLMKVTYRSPATWGPFSYREFVKYPTEHFKDSWWYKAEYGGGSILDYACYGAILSTWMFGKRAERVCCMTKQFVTTFSDVEDWSAMLLDFGDGVGMIEGSWATYNSGEVPSGPILHGTEGTIVCERHSTIVKVYEGKSHTPVEPTEIIDAGIADQSTALGKHLARVIRGEEEPVDMLSTEVNLSVVAALDAGIKSAKTGKTVEAEK
ncbi:MAG: Gfo/Idh/MocA family oxidoreductase [Clostridia bacterium]|nr:Gfo/Idh/MocA family oxidoreductase [Clostridia bacterium]